jgi:hypothetical protein
MATLREQLSEQCGEAPWALLKAHHSRGALVLVAPELDLVEVGMAVIQDQKTAVEGWLNNKQISPFPDALAHKQPTLRCLIAQPWVLAQESFEV